MHWEAIPWCKRGRPSLMPPSPSPHTARAQPLPPTATQCLLDRVDVPLAGTYGDAEEAAQRYKILSAAEHNFILSFAFFQILFITLYCYQNVLFYNKYIYVPLNQFLCAGFKLYSSTIHSFYFSSFVILSKCSLIILIYDCISFKREITVCLLHFTGNCFCRKMQLARWSYQILLAFSTFWSEVWYLHC